MTRPRTSSWLLLGVTAVLALNSSPAYAEQGHSRHEARLQSVEWIPRTGDVVVTAKVSCSAEGSMSWQTSVSQRGRRDLGSLDIPCDGRTRIQSIVLDARKKRFHAGSSEFTFGTVVCEGSDCYGGIEIRTLRLHPSH